MAHAAPRLTARRAGLVACRHCAHVWPAGTPVCGVCRASLTSRAPHSLQRVWAWWVAGVVTYIPANLFPMMKTSMLGDETASTIIGGVLDLLHHDAAFVAAVVFLASVCIPLGKFLAIAWIALALRRPAGSVPAHQLHRVHALVEFIGRWSMIDVFVVAILSALVQFSVVVSIHPGLAAISFACSVGFTMLSAQSLDPRLIYDASEQGRT
ncbi:paraquat-inducible protein A [Mangrovicoccus algicola]|uniref:Paraquat-inducible protein A n=1 Tax=Mangrovicoccus algicola TaxID=2771008 RepID=A0A8J6YWU5_9RHOB|nr:paraquat-inducible protein A [Mangrovicoccus algicola]MBE3639212.1 paraquat-inducible protein A [Mangrovicoccus algicola]